MDCEREGARFSPVPNKSKRFCCVYGCKSLSKRDTTVRFHKFPKEGEFVKINNQKADRRKEWIRLLRMGKKVTESMHVCSLHFKKEDYILPDIAAKRRHLKKIAVPKCNLPKSSIANAAKAKPSDINRAVRLLNRMVKQKENSDVEVIGDVEASFPGPSNSNVRVDEININDKNSGSLKLNASTQVKSGDLLTSVCDLISTEEQLNTFTGLNSFSMLNNIVEGMKLIRPERRLQRLSIPGRVIMTFMKLKQRSSYAVLAILFRCASITACKKIIIKTIDILVYVLKSAIKLPTKEEISRNMPKCFEKFSNTVIILDCIEIPLMKPKLLRTRVITYSHYKQTCTVKFMTGVAPAGLITFISKAYGGRVSDKMIFEQSGLIELLKENDEVMVDKGFLIDEICFQYNIKLCRPPFVRGNKRLREEEAVRNVEIASARVHVERANQRIKVFDIFNKFPTSLLNRVNEVFFIACAVVNVSTPILALDKF